MQSPGVTVKSGWGMELRSFMVRDCNAPNGEMTQQ